MKTINLIYVGKAKNYKIENCIIKRENEKYENKRIR